MDWAFREAVGAKRHLLTAAAVSRSLLKQRRLASSSTLTSGLVAPLHAEQTTEQPVTHPCTGPAPSLMDCLQILVLSSR